MLNLTAFFLLFLQSDSGSTPATLPTSGSSAIVDLAHNIGPIAAGVLLLLALASIYSWTVILSKIGTLRRATQDSRRFIRSFRKATRLQDIATLVSDCPASPMAQVFEDVYETYKRQTGGTGAPRNIAPLERSAQTAASEAVTALERRLTWLATIASASPFIGLFGTVMGVVDAFHGLGTEGSATLHAVAPGISEALITTAAGLFVAVPAVVAYNQLSARIRVFASAIDDFCRELLNSIEEIPQRAPQAPAPNSGYGREAERGVYK
ncbi:MotA/TolQ/ExbB proton channel family protein [Telmatobacter bradus]|uniref:MotA/TolQ/ExbB proton channel family protein n=1 Tax=Telmatobacter bradus TaxID=474953 RepID=UPI003B430977